MTTIAEHLMEKGKMFEAHDVLIEDLEDQFGSVPTTLTEKLQQIQDREVLRSSGVNARNVHRWTHSST